MGTDHIVTATDVATKYFVRIDYTGKHWIDFPWRVTVVRSTGAHTESTEARRSFMKRGAAFRWASRFVGYPATLN